MKGTPVAFGSLNMVVGCITGTTAFVLKVPVSFAKNFPISCLETLCRYL